jgi:hypothetical protein
MTLEQIMQMLQQRQGTPQGAAVPGLLGRV